MSSKHFERPANLYVGEAGLLRRDKYQVDENQLPPIPISAVKVDGDINYLIDAVNELYDTAVSGVLPDGSVTNAKFASGTVGAIKMFNLSGAMSDLVPSTAGLAIVSNGPGSLPAYQQITSVGLATNAVTSDKITDLNVTTAKINDNAVTLAKLAAATQASVLIGRQSGSTGNFQEITLGAGLTMSGSGVLNTSGSGLQVNTITYTQPTVTCTISIASPAVITVTAATLPRNGSPVRFTTTGALPTGLATGTTYWVVNASGSTYNVAATKGGTAINTSGTQSGTHTVQNAPYEKPTGLLGVYIRTIGGGGNGGASSGGSGTPTNTRGGGGGGAGGYAEGMFTPAQLGTSETVTTGAIGSTSSFGSLLSATGGADGGAGTLSGQPGTGGLGGTASGGDFNASGQCGEFGGGGTSDGSGSVGGNGAPSVLAGGGRGGRSSTTNATAGGGEGAGGGGGGAATGTTSSASGVKGIVIVTEYRG